MTLQARLLNPPTPDHKETIYYMHPTLGRQRWLFARSWVAPSAPSPSTAGQASPMAAPIPTSTGPHGRHMPFASPPTGASFSHGRFSTGGIYSHASPFAMPSPSLPEAFSNGPQYFEEENPVMGSYGGGGYGGVGYGMSRQSMYTRPQESSMPSIMKSDWSTGTGPRMGGMPF